jgi:hypothetical protein
MNVKAVATSLSIAVIAAAISLGGLWLIAWCTPGVAAFLWAHPRFTSTVAVAVFWIPTVGSVVARRRARLHGG